MGGDIGDQLGTGGGAPLVADHAEAIALLRQAQHGAGKVAAACGIDPAGAEDQVPGRVLADQGFSCQLGLAVDIERCGGIGFLPGLLAGAVKHVIGGVMHQQCAQTVCLLGQHAHGGGIDALRQLWLAFCLVYRRVGGCIDDDVWLQQAHGGGQGFGIGQITMQRLALQDGVGGAITSKRPDRSQRGQAALQFPADLAVAAQQ